MRALVEQYRQQRIMVCAASRYCSYAARHTHSLARQVVGRHDVKSVALEYGFQHVTNPIEMTLRFPALVPHAVDGELLLSSAIASHARVVQAKARPRMVKTCASAIFFPNFAD